MTKKTIIILLLAASAIGLAYFSLYFSFIGGVAGFVVAKLGGGKREGVPGRVKSLVVSWRRYEFHLHHWSVSSLFMSISALNGFYLFNPQVFFGFMAGLAVQGIYCYDDWHRLVRIRTEPLTSI